MLATLWSLMFRRSCRDSSAKCLHKGCSGDPLLQTEARLVKNLPNVERFNLKCRGLTLANPGVKVMTSPFLVKMMTSPFLVHGMLEEVEFLWSVGLSRFGVSVHRLDSLEFVM